MRRALQELYRHLIEDFLVQYCRRLRKKDFTTKAKRVKEEEGKTRVSERQPDEAFDEAA